MLEKKLAIARRSSLNAILLNRFIARKAYRSEKVVSRLVSRGKLGNPSYARPSPSVPRATSLHKFGSTKPPFWTMKSRRLAGCRKQKNLSPPAPVGGEIRNLSERLLFWEMHIGMSCELNILQDFLGTNRCDRGPSKSNNKSAGATVAYLMWRWLCQPGNRST